MLPFLLALTISIPQTGRVVLPAGVVNLTSEMQVPAGAHDLVITGHRDGTILRLAPGFSGRAAIVCKKGLNIRLSAFAIDGGRASTQRVGLPPSDVRFADFYKRNGILADAVEGLSINRVSFRDIWALAIVVSRSKRVRIERVTVQDSGGRDVQGRNNSTGGILLEEGTTGFEVRQSTFEGIRGNAIWTHSNYGSPRNERGLIAENRFHDIGRDAIQVGHATEVRVQGNTGTRIGYPFDAVDPNATPVGIDTAGNVDHSIYTQNRFEELNGKCIDLDGFHDGDVTFNTCVNKRDADSYPNGQFAIVVNNANIDMTSQHITIADNTIDGAKFGGIFLIGSNHTVVRNKLLNLNLAHCNENAAKYFGCAAIPGEPDLLQAGIYVGRRAERAAPAKGHIIRDNVITGYKMDTRCVMSGPDVDLNQSKVEGNKCGIQP